MWRKMWRAYRGKGRFYSQDAFPGLPLDVVVTHILGSANLPDPGGGLWDARRGRRDGA